MHMLNRSTRLSFTCAIVLAAAPAFAGTVLQPAGASTSMHDPGSADYDPARLISRAGLWNPYTSGVTDFDSYIASQPGHAAGDDWYSDFWRLTGNIDLDLGGVRSIEGMALWSYEDAMSVNQFRLLAADNAGFANAAVIGVFSNVIPVPGTSSNSHLPNVFKFASTNASFIRIEVLSNHGSVFKTSLLEVAFDESIAASAVPEPSTLGALASGAVGLLIARRRRSS